MESSLIKDTYAVLEADYFRFGASSLLDDVLKQIKKLKTNAYQSSYYFPRG